MDDTTTTLDIAPDAVGDWRRRFAQDPSEANARGLMLAVEFHRAADEEKYKRDGLASRELAKRHLLEKMFEEAQVRTDGMGDLTLARRLYDVLPDYARLHPPSEGRLPTMTVGELLDKPDDATPFLVDGILPAGGLSALSGKPKSGKTTAARHLAHCVASGERFLERGTQTGPAIYVGLEDKEADMRRHFKALGTSRTAPLHVCLHRPLGDSIGMLRETAAKIAPVLVVVDTLYRFQPVGDTSSYGDVLKALTPLHELARDSGAHVMVVHHERKSEAEGMDRMLGSQALAGTVDVMMSIERRHADNVRVVSTFGRYDDFPETVIELRPDGRVELTGDVGDIRERRARDAVLAYLDDNPGATQAELRDGCGLRWQVANVALKALMRDGKVERTGGGGRSDPYSHHAVRSCSRTPGDPGAFHVPVPPTGGNTGTSCSGTRWEHGNKMGIRLRSRWSTGNGPETITGNAKHAEGLTSENP